MNLRIPCRCVRWSLAAGIGVAAMLALLPGGGRALAQDKPPAFEETELMFLGEELYTVSIASRRIETLQRAPAAVTVISAEELKKYRTLAEVLRRVPGFFIDRNEVKERIYLRGIPDSFLVLMDGVPFSCDATTIDYPRGLDLSLNYIEKIEIVRGPGSALWGPDAFSGIINLVTKKGADLQGVSLTAEGGSFDTKRAETLAGFNRKDWDGLLFMSTTKTKGFEHDLHNGQERPHDHYDEAYGKLSYKDILEISGRYSRYRDFYSEPVFMYEGSEHKPLSFIQATLNKSFEKSAFSLQGWFQYFDNEDSYGKSQFTQNNKQYALEAKYDFSLWEQHYLSLGSSFRYNDGSKTTFTFEDQDFDYFRRYFTRRYSGYFQDKWKIAQNLEATAGVRYDDHSIYGEFTSPRAGLNYLFWDYFNAKLLYGRAFRTPTLAFLIEQVGLKPERIDSYEAELGFHYKNLFGVEANFFYNKLKDLIERDASGAIRNTGEENIKGVELSITGKPHRSVSVYANYSHVFGNRQRGTRATIEIPDIEDPSQTTESTIESFLNVAPDNVFNCGIDYSFLRYCRASLELNYVDERKLGTLAQATEPSVSLRKNLGSYVLWDFYLSVKDLPFKNLELALKLKNITAKKYDTRGVFGLVDGMGRATFITLNYRF
jgi:outer membrane cobalamin receptor